MRDVEELQKSHVLKDDYRAKKPKFRKYRMKSTV